jgi:hypothetical protein
MCGSVPSLLHVISAWFLRTGTTLFLPGVARRRADITKAEKIHCNY